MEDEVLVKCKIPKHEWKNTRTEHGLPHNPSHMNVRLGCKLCFYLRDIIITRFTSHNYNKTY